VYRPFGNKMTKSLVKNLLPPKQVQNLHLYIYAEELENFIKWVSTGFGSHFSFFSGLSLEIEFWEPKPVETYILRFI
jgi:hypothetical protein